MLQKYKDFRIARRYTRTLFKFGSKEKQFWNTVDGFLLINVLLGPQ